MRNQWTREGIIRHLLEREAQGLPFTVGGNGIDKLLYAAARRIFGSWRNAVQAAGIPPERALTWERWSPAKILLIIRNLAQRDRPLSAAQMERRYSNMMGTARRHFGSWTKAVLAAGVDPTRLQRVVPWRQERVIEAILTRALRSESLVARFIEPRSLVEAGQRFFGSWAAAVTAAGMDPKMTVLPPRRAKSPAAAKAPGQCAKAPRGPQRLWTKDLIITALRARVREQKPISPAALAREDSALYCAARRHLGNWRNALLAAGLDPAAYQRSNLGNTPANEGGKRRQVTRQSQNNDGLRPDRPA